jgi:hypothetical protein
VALFIPEFRIDPNPVGIGIRRCEKGGSGVQFCNTRRTGSEFRGVAESQA